MRKHSGHFSLYLLVIISLLLACDEDDEVVASAEICDETSTPVYEESSSILLVEFESAAFEGDWILVNDLSNATGQGYMQWDGENQFNRPGVGLATFKISIKNPGDLQILMAFSG